MLIRHVTGHDTRKRLNPPPQPSGSGRCGGCAKFRPRTCPHLHAGTVWRRELMNSLFTRACALALTLSAFAAVQAQGPAARFGVREMLKLQRVADPQLS